MGGGFRINLKQFNSRKLFHVKSGISSETLSMRFNFLDFEVDEKRAERICFALKFVLLAEIIIPRLDFSSIFESKNDIKSRLFVI